MLASKTFLESCLHENLAEREMIEVVRSGITHHFLFRPQQRDRLEDYHLPKVGPGMAPEVI